jgi:TatA/E family protein of Tat protein translocase
LSAAGAKEIAELAMLASEADGGVMALGAVRTSDPALDGAMILFKTTVEIHAGPVQRRHLGNRWATRQSWVQVSAQLLKAAAAQYDEERRAWGIIPEGGTTGSLSVWHWLIVILVLLLLFGGDTVSHLMGDFAKDIKSFK